MTPIFDQLCKDWGISNYRYSYYKHTQHGMTLRIWRT